MKLYDACKRFRTDPVYRDWLRFRWRYSAMRHRLHVFLRRFGFKVYGGFTGTSRPAFTYEQYRKYRGLKPQKKGARSC